MKINYLIVGLVMLMLLSIGCIGDKNRSGILPNSDSSISSRITISESSGIFSEYVKPTSQSREYKLKCANKLDKYTATYNNGDYIEISWLNNVVKSTNDYSNPICEQLNRFHYVSGNYAYELNYDSSGDFSVYSGRTGELRKGLEPEPQYSFTKDDVTKDFNEFSKVSHDKIAEIIKRYESGQLKSLADSKRYIDRNNISSAGNFVIKISGTPDTKFTATISTKPGGIDQYQDINGMIPKEITVSDLSSLVLKYEDVGLITLQIIKDNKLIFSTYTNNENGKGIVYNSENGRDIVYNPSSDYPEYTTP